MADSDMDRLLQQARINDAERDGSAARDFAASQAGMVDEIARWASSVRAITTSWLIALSEAGYPGVGVVRNQQTVQRGLLAKRQEMVIREVPGWKVVERLLSTSINSGSLYGTLYVLVDGRLVYHAGGPGGNEFDPETHYELRGGQLTSSSHPPMQVVQALPDGLIRIAMDNGVAWTPPFEALPEVRAQ
jgi:hypothetical protein